jgi:hypothetical protein
MPRLFKTLLGFQTLVLNSLRKMAQDCASLEAPISAPPKGKLVKLTSDPRKAPPNIPCLQRAKSVLEQNGIVALPTDTIYGLAGLAQSTEAIKSIYNIKERHNEKPLSICVGSISDIKNWAHVSCTEALLQDLLPGGYEFPYCLSPKK